MTIEEKADEYIGHPQEIDEGVDVYMQRKAFIQGAEWMQKEQLAKAVRWFTGYLGKIGYPDDWLRDSKVQQSGMERFIKAMEE